MDNFEKENLAQYIKIFGAEKMKGLWKEFLESAQEGFLKIGKTNVSESVRLIYHNLHSSSLVFGMKGFSDMCGKIEKAIMQGQKIEKLEKEIQNSKMVYEKEVQKVDEYLMKR